MDDALANVPIHGYPLDYLRSLPDGSLSAREVMVLCNEIERLQRDRNLLVQALRELSGEADDDAIAFRFDAPGARLHERLRSILTETGNSSKEAP